MTAFTMAVRSRHTRAQRVIGRTGAPVWKRQAKVLGKAHTEEDLGIGPGGGFAVWAPMAESCVPGSFRDI